MAVGTQITSGQLMDKIIYALEKKEPLSVISIGITESFVMAQYTIYSEKEFMNHPEAIVANEGSTLRGIRFPNVKARDEAVDAVRNADIVGYNTIIVPYRKLAKQVFKAYDLNPKFVFEAYIRRVIVLSQKEKFAEMLRGRKILLIGSQAKNARETLDKDLADKLGFEIVDAIPIYAFEEIPKVKMQIDRNDFDLCLLGAGINAVILAPYIVKTYGKVAFDIGKSMKTLATGNIVGKYPDKAIGFKNLMSM